MFQMVMLIVLLIYLLMEFILKEILNHLVGLNLQIMNGLILDGLIKKHRAL